MTFAKASLLTLYGEVSSSWEVVGEEFRLTIKVPPNTTAEVVLPGSPSEFFGPGQHSLTKIQPTS